MKKLDQFIIKELSVQEQVTFTGGIGSVCGAIGDFIVGELIGAAVDAVIDTVENPEQYYGNNVDNPWSPTLK